MSKNEPPTGGGGRLRGPQDTNYPSPPKGPPATASCHRYQPKELMGAEGAQLYMYMYQKHYPERLTWGEI